MATKIKDLAVKVGEYTDAQGQTKGRYENIGVLMQGDNGQYILMKKTFNPAGVSAGDGRDTIMVSMFDPQQQQQGGQRQQGQRQAPPPRTTQTAPAGAPMNDDDLPF